MTEEMQDITAVLGEEEAALYLELTEKEEKLNAAFRHAKMHFRMMDLRHSRMKLRDGIKIFLWIGSWIMWKLAFWDIGQIPGMGHRWGRVGGTLYVLCFLIPFTYFGVKGLYELLMNSKIPYFMRLARKKGYSSLAIEKEKSEDVMYAASDELGPVQFQLEKYKERIQEERKGHA